MKIKVDIFLTPQQSQKFVNQIDEFVSRKNHDFLVTAHDLNKIVDDSDNILILEGDAPLIFSFIKDLDKRHENVQFSENINFYDNFRFRTLVIQDISEKKETDPA